MAKQEQAKCGRCGKTVKWAPSRERPMYRVGGVAVEVEGVERREGTIEVCFKCFCEVAS